MTASAFKRRTGNLSGGGGGGGGRGRGGGRAEREIGPRNALSGHPMMQKPVLDLSGFPASLLSKMADVVEENIIGK